MVNLAAVNNISNAFISVTAGDQNQATARYLARGARPEAMSANLAKYFQLSQKRSKIFPTF
jgi:hypothetical protein